MPVGTGRMIPVIAGQGKTVLAGDASAEMVAIASQRLSSTERAVFIVCEAERLPFRSKSIDLVISVRFFQHLPVDAVLGVLRDFARVARFGVLVQAPIPQRISPFISALARLKTVVLGRSIREQRRARERQAHLDGEHQRHMFPAPLSEFDELAARAGLTITRADPVTSRMGQLRLIQLEPRC